MSLCPAPHLLCGRDLASQLSSPLPSLTPLLWHPNPSLAAISWPPSFLSPVPPSLSPSLLHHICTLLGTQPASTSCSFPSVSSSKATPNSVDLGVKSSALPCVTASLEIQNCKNKWLLMHKVLQWSIISSSGLRNWRGWQAERLRWLAQMRQEAEGCLSPGPPALCGWETAGLNGPVLEGMGIWFLM